MCLLLRDCSYELICLCSTLLDPLAFLWEKVGNFSDSVIVENVMWVVAAV